MADGGRRGAAGGVETVVRTSVATLYSNLVTRPTGRAVRVAIERQIMEAGGVCLSILDFTHVGVVDFSCADEVVAKLLLKYSRPERPAEAYFLASGIAEHHREPIESVLQRHNLLLVTVKSDGRALWGPAPARLRRAWNSLDRLGRAFAHEFASTGGLSQSTARSWLKRLVASRVAVPDGEDCFCSLPAILDLSVHRH